MAIPLSLATTDDYTSLIGAVPAGVVMAEVLDSASAVVRRYAGWHIGPTVTEDVTLDGRGGVLLVLPTLALSAVTSISDSGQVIDPASVQWSTDGYLYRNAATVPAGGGWASSAMPAVWSCNLRGVTVNITHGFDPIPYDVVALVCGVAARAVTSPVGVVREQTGQVSVQYSPAPDGIALTQAEMATLDSYRLPRFR